jgi:hypothetical protein
LKEELEKLGLDVDVAMEELGLGESATISSSLATTQSTGEGGETSTGDGKGEDDTAGYADDNKGLASDQNLEDLLNDTEMTEEQKNMFTAVTQVLGLDALTIADALENLNQNPPPPTPIPDGTGVGEKNVWEKFIDWLFNLFGIDGEGSLPTSTPTITPTPTATPTQTPTPTPQPTPTPTLTAEEQKQADIEAEIEELINKGIPEEGLYYIPKNHILDYSGFGYGYSLTDEFGTDPWEKYRDEYSDPYKGAQYLIPDKLVSEKVQSKVGNLRNSYNGNLCGQLAIIAALGLDIEEGMNIFSEFVSQGYNILQNDETTSDLNLINFFKVAVGKRINEIYTTRLNDEKPLNTKDEFAETLASGNIIIANVTIDSTQEGRLMDRESSHTDTPHWVWVQEIIPTKEDDNPLVRVYNPFMNREEVYDWNTFSSAYEDTVNENLKLAVVVSLNEP